MFRVLPCYVRCDMAMTSQITCSSFLCFADWRTLITYLIGIVMVTCVVLGSIGGMATLSALSTPGTAGAANATSAANAVPVSSCRQNQAR